MPRNSPKQIKAIQKIVEERTYQEMRFDPHVDNNLKMESWLLILGRQVGLASDDGGVVKDKDRYFKQLTRLGATVLAAMEAYYHNHPELLEINFKEKGNEGRGKDGSS